MYNCKNIEIITNKIMEVKEIIQISGLNNKGTIEVLLNGVLDGIKQQESLSTLSMMIQQQQYLN